MLFGLNHIKLGQASIYPLLNQTVCSNECKKFFSSIWIKHTYENKYEIYLTRIIITLLLLMRI